MSITIAICEDEKNIREELARLTENLGMDCRADCYESGDALLDAGKRYDIYLLDIQMPGRNGMELSRKIRSDEGGSDPIIIFVTALKEYMPEAFDVQAYHFLTKPIDEEKFHAVLSGAVNQCLKRTEAGHLVVKNDGFFRSVELHDILFVESFNKKVILHTRSEQIEHYGKISEFEQKAEFFRCHRCFVVNMAHIARYTASMILLTDGSEVILSRKKYSEFVKAYMKHAMK